MGRVIPFLSVKNCKEAIERYKKALNATVVGEISYLHDFEGFEDQKDKIAHCSLNILGETVFINDDIDDEEPIEEKTHIVLEFPTIESLDKAFKDLKEDGYLYYDLQEVPWSELCGNLRDKFNVNWMMYLRKEDNNG